MIDVGGGNGTLLGALWAAHPELRGRVLDLPPSAEAAEATFAEAGLTGRASAVPGSFFDPLPAGADAYLLSDILRRRCRSPSPVAGRCPRRHRQGRETARL